MEMDGVSLAMLKLDGLEMEILKEDKILFLKLELLS